MSRPLVIGTRGSALSLKQVDEFTDLFKRRHPDHSFEVKVVSTMGDRDKSAPISRFGSKGVFVAELEKQIEQGAIDVAIHSLKDMPSEEMPGFRIAAVLPRSDPRDVLVTAGGLALDQLPGEARLGSGSPRRSAQVKAARPDLLVQDIRGNIDTRIQKVRRGDYDGAILAAAGLIRMGWQDQIADYLPVDVCMPAVGQGALAIEIREDDPETWDLVKPLDDPPTRQAVEAERSLLRSMGGGCLAPIAAYGANENGRLRLRGIVADPHTHEIIRAEVTDPTASPQDLGAQLAKKLFSLGAARVLEAVSG